MPAFGPEEPPLVAVAVPGFDVAFAVGVVFAPEVAPAAGVFLVGALVAVARREHRGGRALSNGGRDVDGPALPSLERGVALGESWRGPGAEIARDAFRRDTAPDDRTRTFGRIDSTIYDCPRLRYAPVNDMVSVPERST